MEIIISRPKFIVIITVTCETFLLQQLYTYKYSLKHGSDGRPILLLGTTFLHLHDTINMRGAKASWFVRSSPHRAV